jgi:Holliday junction resolvase RusA-like endonuclease
MQRTKTFIISGDCVPLARGRVGSNVDGSYHVYDSQKNLKLVKSIDLQKQMNDDPLFEGPLSVEAIFYMKMPKTPSKQKDLNGTLCKHRPDVDNLLKFLLDISNKLLWKDDAEVSICKGTKIYDHNPRTEFVVTEVRI